MFDVKLTINGVPVEVEAGSTILKAAATIGLKIPTLCHFRSPDFDVTHCPASCRVCQVSVVGRGLVTACSTPVSEGMGVRTNTPEALQARRTVLELILSNHPRDCLTCGKSGRCELQALADDFHLRDIRYQGRRFNHEVDTSSFSIVRDMNKCIMCRRCETACNLIQTVGVLGNTERGFDSVMDTAMHRPLIETKCTFCGQCAAVCPTGALLEMNHIARLWHVLNDPAKFVVVQVAPAVRVAIAEMFGQPPGTIATGRLVAALRALGFNRVFDTNFGADLTVWEESTEFLHRLESDGPLPMLTSCCPGWVKFFEHQFPDLLHVPSSCKSPQQMFGAVAKTFFAEKVGINPRDMVVVSIMPCLAKKYELHREEHRIEGFQEVDISISTRELGYMLEEACIDLNHFPEESFDHPLGDSSGAAVLFGGTGGVLEAMLRTVAARLSDRPLNRIEFHDARGMNGLKETTVQLNGRTIHAGIASGLGNARELLNHIRHGDTTYDIIEIMACPGGCIGGGGQPYHHGDMNVLKQRLEALYQIDQESEIRNAHENPAMMKLYEEFLGEPGSKRARELLHTRYFARTRE